MSMADGLIMRSLMNFPGGLELHIGVHPLPLSPPRPGLFTSDVCCHKPGALAASRIIMPCNDVRCSLKNQSRPPLLHGTTLLCLE